VAVSKSIAADRGGVYRLDSDNVALDMTNDVNIRKMAEDSVGGIYASATLPETAVPGRYCVVAYYRDTNSTWSMLTTNGLPGDFSDGDILGRGLGPVITVGKDSATNDVPVLAVMRTIYYLPYGGSSWVTVTNYPNGTQIKTLFYDELMVGTTIGLYGQGLNAVPVSETSLIPLAGDFDGDRLADPALFNTNGTWKIKLSSGGYTLIPLAGFLGGSGYSAVAGDFDGDQLADPAVYQAATGTWKVKLSTAGYLEVPKPDFLGETGWTAIAADFDGDRLVDPAVYEAATESWVVMLSSAGYAVYLLDPHFLGGTGYTGMAADFDGDRLADPAVAEVSSGHWQIKLSGGGYSLLDLPNFLGE
jgi:hypothetical protein